MIKNMPLYVAKNANIGPAVMASYNIGNKSPIKTASIQDITRGIL